MQRQFRDWLNERQFTKWLNETSNSPDHLARSYYSLRKSVGVIGIASPFVLVIGAMILGNNFVIQDSISSYYYTVTGSIFVGSMCATAIFLISYRYERLDDFVTTIAGASAIGVALFPNKIGLAHGVLAVCFITSLAIMALIFRKSVSKPKDEKLQRNKVYKWCSITIFACVGLLILIFLIQNLPSIPLLKSFQPVLWLKSVLWLEWLKPLNPILVLECIALWAFGFSWFVKGRTIWKDKKEGNPASNSATRKVASFFGVLAGGLGLLHGVFEIYQHNVAPNVPPSGVFIHAMGHPCLPDKVWHQCFPAMTIIQNFFVTGVLAIIVSLIIIIWSLALLRVQWEYGGLVLIVLSIIQLLVGGGFISPILCFIAGLVGTMIQASFTWWSEHISFLWQSFLSKLWPWSWIFPVIALLLTGYVIHGYFFNGFMPILILLTIVIALVLLLFAVLTTITNDIQTQTNTNQAPSVAAEHPQQ